MLSSTFRDLNKNGRLDPYEDPSRPVEERVEDLLSQMMLAEKAGLMMHTMIMPGDLDAVPPFGAAASSREMVIERHMNHFNILYHLLPFGPAFAAGAEQVMPYYGIPQASHL